MNLKAYQYRDHPDSFKSEVVYHRTAKEAKALGVSKIGYEEEFTDIQCHRFKDADKYAPGEPAVENSMHTLRQLGWRYEDEDTCGCCGLAAMGLSKYEICTDCSQCAECGCECDD